MYLSDLLGNCGHAMRVMLDGTSVTVEGGEHDVSGRFWRNRSITKEVKHEDNT